jgi:hypothetical protein
MLTENLLMTFVKNTTGSSSQKSLKGFQSTYHWKLFTKVIKRISVNIPLEALHKVIKRISESFQWYVD